MYILNKYLSTKIITVTFVTLLAVTLLLFFMQATKYLDLIITKGLQIKYLIYISFLSMPSIWNELIPITIFFSILFIWQIMINNNEIIIMQAVGLSPWQIAKPILLIGLVGAIICFIFSLVFINSTYLKFLDLRSDIKNNLNIRIIGSNKFMQLNKDITIYIGKTNKDGLLKNVLIDNQTLNNEYAIYAETARIVKQNKDLKILLNNGSIQKLDKNNKTVNFINFDVYILTIPETTKNKEYLERTSAKKMYLWELIFYKNLNFMKELKLLNPAEYSKKVASFIIETNKRCSNVVLALVLPVIGTYFFFKKYF